MFLPIGDTPNPPDTPYVNCLLIGANVAVFLLISLPLIGVRADANDPLLMDYLRAVASRSGLPLPTIYAQTSAYDLFTFRYGFRPAVPSPMTLMTSIFLHGGWAHLLGNMLFLWIFGDNVEYRLGRLPYLLVYLGTGIFSNLFFAAFTPDSPYPLVGASGAISGVLGCYYFWFPKNRVRTFVFLFPFIMTTFLIPARLVLGFYLIVDNLLPFLLTGGGGTGVAHGAHIGGFLAGLAVAFGVERLPEFRHRLSPLKDFQFGAVRQDHPGPGEEDRSPPDRGQSYSPVDIATYERLQNKAERMRVGDTDVLAIGDSLLAAREYDRALSVFRRFVAERQNSPFLDRALLGAGKSLCNKERCATSAYHYFLAALDVARNPGVAEEARRYLEGIGGR